MGSGSQSETYTRELHNLLTKKIKKVILPKQYAKFGPKSKSTTKQRMFRAINLRQSREFYTNAVSDVGDI